MPQNISLYRTNFYEQCLCFVLAVYIIYCCALHRFGLDRVMEPQEKRCLFYKHTCLKQYSYHTTLYHPTLCCIAALCWDWPVKGSQMERSRGEKQAYSFTNRKREKGKNSHHKMCSQALSIELFWAGTSVLQDKHLILQLPVVPSGPGPIHTS